MIGQQLGGLTLARHVDRKRLVEHRRGERAAGDDPGSVGDERDLRGIGRAGRVGCVVAEALEVCSAEAAAAGSVSASNVLTIVVGLLKVAAVSVV